MRFIAIFSFVTIVAGSTSSRRDPCKALCDEFAADGLCGEAGSRCIDNTNCSDLFWFDEELTQMISGDLVGPNDDARNRPVFCSDAEAVMQAREASDIQPIETGCILQEPVVNPRPVSLSIAGVRGISNLGNTCYVSSAIQILAHITPLRRLLQPLMDAGSINVQEVPLINQPAAILVNAVVDVMRQIWSGTSLTPINIGSMINALNIHTGVPGDSHEVFIRIMDGLQTFGIAVNEVVQFQRRGTRLCSVCESITQENPVYSEILIPLRQGMTNISLRDGMEMFFGNEEIFGFECGDCHQSEIPIEAVDRGFVQGGPGEVLMVNFQRVNQETGGRINTVVDFPLEMNLADMPGNGQGRYRLVGIVNHTGGHYYSEVAIDGHWYLIDDGSAIDLGNQPETLNSRFVTNLVYERIPEQQVIQNTNSTNSVAEQSQQ